MKEEEYIRKYSMTKDEYFKTHYNKVDHIHAVCLFNSSWMSDYPELEIGKTYKVSHIGVFRSSTEIILEEFDDKKYEAGCFELYENDERIDGKYTRDPRFYAPYLRNMLRRRCPFSFKKEIERHSIPAHLTNIETMYNVKVLLAVEAGSRALGLESINSDWDVRIIYVHRPEWYQVGDEKDDVIEHCYEDDVDIVGWDLRKALTLLQDSDPFVLECFYSPNIYYVDEEFAIRIHEVEKDLFIPVKAMCHYNRMYIKLNERYLLKEGCQMKHFLYYLRGILACKWIEKNNCLPPVPFDKLLDATIEDKEVRSKIAELVRLKKDGQEHDMIEIDKSLVEYACKLADYYNEIANSAPLCKGQVSAETLDSILNDMVIRNTNRKLLSKEKLFKALDEKGIEYDRMQISNAYFPLKDVEACMDKVIPPLPNHLPCPLCGKPSEQLTWINFKSPQWTWKELMGRSGPLSICPDCHCLVEFKCFLMN